VKAAIVARFGDMYHIYVWAFGDSILDLLILSKVDQAIIVVGEEQTRSKTIDAVLLNAVDNDGLRARQALLLSNVLLCLDTTKLPLI